MKKLLSFILALAMVVCLIPAGVFAGEGGEILTTIHMNTTSPTARLYAASDSQKATNLLASVIANEKTYAISLNAGSYLLEAVGTDGLTENGSIVLHVSAETNTFTVVTVTMSCSNEDWAYDTDFAFEDLHVVSGGGGVTESRMVTMGNSVEANKKTVPVLDGDSVTVALDPSAAKKLDNYVKVNGNKTVNTGFDALSIDPATGTSLQVTYPYADEDADGNNDFILEAGQLLSGTYYRYTYMTPASISTPESNTVTANFVGLVKNNTYYYRVTNPSLEDAVTYGNYITLNKAVNTATVTADNLYLNNARNKHTVVDDFSLNTYDSGDLYLSVRNTELGVYAGFDGAAGTISMNVGDEINLYPFRNWLAIESTSNAKVIEPDFHVQVVTLDGTSPVSVTERMANDDSKHSFRVEANGEGTALLLVTYDAMTSDIAMGKKTSMDGKTFFSAIWPENTGVLVVSVDKESGIATGMTINESLNSAAGSKLSGEKLDAELDVLYYAGTQGAKYSFKPEQGTVVTKADPVYTDGRLNSGAFSTTGISTAADGTVTLFGLKQGKTLVKLVNGNKTAYQVIRARQTDYKVYTGTKAADSNLLYDSSTGFENAGIEVKAGDKIFVQYSDLQHPANKLSGIYNMTANVSALGEDGTLATGKGNQYNFGATASAHGVSLQLPKYWTEDTYSFEGILNVSGFGSYYGQHRDLAYETGKSPNFVAVQQNGYFGSLPGYTVNLGETDFVTVKLNPLDNDESAAKGVSFVVTDEAGVSSSVDGNGAFTALPGLTYSFRAFADGYEYKMGTIVVPAEQTADMTVDVVLEKAAEGAWDGSTKTEPQLIEDVYQIGTGAELAWLSSEIFEGRCLDAKVVLTADLDMGKYPLTPMGRKTSYNWQTGEINRDFQFNGTFDGNGKTIRNFYVSGSGNTGLFAYVKKAVIKDFTIEGLVESTGANTAAVAASVSGSAQISGVISKVDIKSSSNVVGAIIGNVSSAGVVVSQCANMGSISGKMSVAGLVGSTSSYLFTVNECFNTGAVSGTYRVGGIVGYANGASGKTVSISSCFNYIAKIRMHGLRQTIATSCLKNIHSSALTRLRINTNNGLVLAIQICRVDRQIRNFPIFSARVLHVFIAFTNSILVGTRECCKTKFPCIRLTRRNCHLGNFLINLTNFHDIREIQFRINVLSKHIQCNSNNIKIASTFAIAEECAFNTVSTCHQTQFSTCYTSTTVIVRMQGDNCCFTILHMSTEIFDLIRIGVSSTHFYSRRKINNNWVFFSCTHFIHNCFTNFYGIINFSTGKGFGGIFIADIHTRTSNFFFSQLFDKFSSVYGNFSDTFHIFLENNFSLQCRSGIIKMDNYIFSTTNCFKGFAD